ncbi:MAG: SDR family NAD(P)-dependent oxidoreductase, partial [Pseudomonadales bacterium]
MTKYDYNGKVVLITGAGSGFGKMAAEKFSAAGASLALSDINVESVDAVAEELRTVDANVVSMACDVSKEGDVQQFVAATVAEYGKLDVAINNAGMAHELTKMTECDEALWDITVAVNLKGVFLCMKHELQQMSQQGCGVILNVSSAAGILGAPLLGPYAAAKHGVVGLTRTGAVEFARKGIRVNAICPAFSHTPLVDKLVEQKDESRLSNMASHIPMQRLGQSDEIVQAMLWACSDDN